MSQAVSAKRTPSRHKARAWSHEGTSTTLRFAVAFGLTAAYVAFAVWASSPWRAELRDAIGPVMAWVIPIFLAYVPAVLDRLHGLHADHAALPRPIAGSAQRPMAGG